MLELGGALAMREKSWIRLGLKAESFGDGNVDKGFPRSG